MPTSNCTDFYTTSIAPTVLATNIADINSDIKEEAIT